MLKHLSSAPRIGNPEKMEVFFEAVDPTVAVPPQNWRDLAACLAEKPVSNIQKPRCGFPSSWTVIINLQLILIQQYVTQTNHQSSFIKLYFQILNDKNQKMDQILDLQGLSQLLKNLGIRPQDPKKNHTWDPEKATHFSSAPWMKQPTESFWSCEKKLLFGI